MARTKQGQKGQTHRRFLLPTLGLFLALLGISVSSTSAQLTLSQVAVPTVNLDYAYYVKGLNNLPQKGSISLNTAADYAKRGYDFRNLKYASTSGGAFYITVSTGEELPKFYANNNGQGGLVDLGLKALSEVEPVTAGFNRYGLNIFPQHTYGFYDPANSSYGLIYVNSVSGFTPAADPLAPAPAQPATPTPTPAPAGTPTITISSLPAAVNGSIEVYVGDQITFTRDITRGFSGQKWQWYWNMGGLNCKDDLAAFVCKSISAEQGSSVYTSAFVDGKEYFSNKIIVSPKARVSQSVQPARPQPTPTRPAQPSRPIPAQPSASPAPEDIDDEDFTEEDDEEADIVLSNIKNPKYGRKTVRDENGRRRYIRGFKFGVEFENASRDNQLGYLSVSCKAQTADGEELALRGFGSHQDKEFTLQPGKSKGSFFYSLGEEEVETVLSVKRHGGKINCDFFLYWSDPVSGNIIADADATNNHVSLELHWKRGKLQISTSHRELK